MKVFISLFLIIFTLNKVFGQDQLKSKFTGKVMQVQITEVNDQEIKYTFQNSIIKTLRIVDIDSIFTLNEKLIGELSYIKVLEGRVVKTQMFDTRKATIENSIVSPTQKTNEDLSLFQVAEQMKINRLEINRIKDAMESSGKTLNLAGSLILTGIGSIAIGSYLIIKDEPKLGTIVSVGGGLMGLIGYAAIIRSGNLLQRTSGKDLRVGLGNNGLAIQLRF
jgi:hypothetical protein